MRALFASRNVVAIAFVIAVGTGCSNSSGCASKPLPAGLTPFGVPNSQVIEGGIQARLTKSGLTKLSTVAEDLLTSSLAGSTACIFPEDKFYGNVGDELGWVVLCPDKPASCSAAACGASIIFDSSQRPAPSNIQDGVDKIDFSMADGTNPVLNIDASFDVDLPLLFDYGAPIIGVKETMCTFEMYTPHYHGTATDSTFHFTAPIQLGIDATTGKLTVTPGAIDIVNVGLQFSASNCGDLQTVLDYVADGLNALASALSSSIGKTIINLGASLLQPQIDAFVKNLLPDPLGLAGVIDTGASLASYDAPTTAGLETFIVPGGYVSAKDNGLTLGVLAGMNSDVDPTTRTATTSSEPDPCVPVRPVPALASAPWSLPVNASRSDFTLNAADAFAGNPDPVDGSGNARDLLFGISRSYFDLIGFHVYNSGTLCLHVDGGTISALSVGTLGALIPSINAISTTPAAPLELVLRPQSPITFTLGAGTMTDSLIHMALPDLRIDMYAWIEDRWARVLTLGVDLDIGIDLTVTKDKSGNPALQPMLSGLDASSVKVNVTNTDLLAETPAALDKILPNLITFAVSSLTGSLPTVSLPSLPGFTLSDLQISKVTTSMDDFLGVFATLMTTSSPAPLIDWTDPVHPRPAGEVITHAAIASMSVPGPTQLAQLFDPSVPAEQKAPLPSVTLALSAEDLKARPIEYAWKIDGSAWHDWTQSSAPVITDNAFLLQGHHAITVRARAVGDYTSEDSYPVVLDALIDTTPPHLEPKIDDKNLEQLDFGGWDLVSDADHLVYSWLDENGKQLPFVKQASLTLAEVGLLTRNATQPLVLSVRDEKGLVTSRSFDMLPYGSGSWGRPHASGSGCAVGGGAEDAPLDALIAIGLVMLWLARRRVRVSGLAIFAAGTLLAGCHHHSSTKLTCNVDDDCSATTCPAGEIPSCQANACGCTADVPPGNTGRFASMVVIGTEAYVAAYNTTYGDLMIGHVTPPGRVASWDFVDGVPDQAPDTAGTHERGGVTAPGPDVGQYTSIAENSSKEPVMAYYDVTDGALKFASFGAIRWRSHIVDQAAMTDSVGTWTSMTVDKSGNPGIAYAAIVNANTPSGMPEGQLRFAQAKVADPQSGADWTITIVDSRPLATMPTATNDLLPDSIAIMTASARRSDDTVVIAYYDRLNGNLRFAEQDTTGAWKASILDGEATDGTDTGDVGQYPSVYVDSADVAYISYVDAARDTLSMIDSKTLTPEVIDDGYRTDDEMTSDGLPSPVYHLVGDNSTVSANAGTMLVAYQDATDLTLRIASRSGTGAWATQAVAGHADPFTGSYGFWAGLQVVNGVGYLGSYVINQQVMPADLFYQTFVVNLGTQGPK